VAAPNTSRPPKPTETAPWTTRRKAIVGTIIGVVAAAIIAVLLVIAYLTGPGAKDVADHNGKGGSTSSPTPSAIPIAVPTSAPLAQPAAIEPGLTAQLTDFESVEGVATTPGSVSAPSVRFTVTITNNTSKAQPLTTTVVNAYYGTANTPALELYSPGGVNLPDSVPAGQSVSGVYLFSIPANDRSDVRFEIDYSASVKPLIFQGSIPN